MNKLAIFDLDGVLCDLRDVHFRALNSALIACGHPPISIEDHLIRFDGLPTSKKLTILGITGDEAKKISELKQAATIAEIPKHVKPNPELAMLLHKVYGSGCLLAVVSNARQETVDLCLELMSVDKQFSWVVTPSGSKMRPKPSPEMFLDVMKAADACPLTTTIFEDSPSGLHAAHLSGARVVQMDGLLKGHIGLSNIHKTPPYRYIWPDLNVVIPAAGKGQRFADAGWTLPKPLIPVGGIPMCEQAHRNLSVDATLTYIFRDRGGSFRDFYPNGIMLPSDTRGTAETCLAAKYNMFGYALRRDFDVRPLLIANCDQILEWDHIAFYYFCQNTSLDAVIVVFDEPEPNPKWSYCEVGSDGLVKRVAEKEPISNIANCGVFFFKHGSDFVKYAERMIQGEMTVNGEYFISPLFNLAIADGKKIGTFKVDKFHSLGTPECLQKYLARKS